MLSRIFNPLRTTMKGVSVQPMHRQFAAKKLGIADALTVLEDKISNISQLVSLSN